MFNIREFVEFKLKHIVEYDLNNLNPNDSESVGKYLEYYSNYEEKAKRIYDSQDDLEGYILEIVTKSKEDSNRRANLFYNKRLDEINEYEVKEEIETKINEFKLEVVNTRKGHVLFKSIINKRNEKELSDISQINEFIAYCFAHHIGRMINYYGKVIFIADFHNNINEWFLYEALFEKFNKSKIKKVIKKPKTFQEIFKAELIGSYYVNVMEFLKNKNLINIIGDKYYWIGLHEFSNSGIHKLLCMFGVLLKVKGCFKSKVKDYEIAKSLSDYFNYPISAQQFSTTQTEYMNHETHKIQDYVDVFHELPVP